MSRFAAFRRWFISLCCCWVALSFVVAHADDAGSPLKLTLRSRTTEDGGERFRVRFTPAEWKPSETAVIVVDMWDNHWCPTSAARVVEIAPRIDAFVAACRERGLHIIHAPSDCMDFYADHPARRRAMLTPKAGKLPDGIDVWCKSIPAEERGKYPIDQSDGGCDAENPPKSANVWKRQIDAIRIDDGRDYISASGSEVWSILEEQGVKNVLSDGSAHQHVRARPAVWVAKPEPVREERRAGSRFDRHDVQPEGVAAREPFPRHAVDRGAHRKICHANDHFGSGARWRAVPV